MLRARRSRPLPTWSLSLTVCFAFTLGSGFTWPGRVPRFVYQAAHGKPEERVDALRWLEQYPSEATTQAVLAALEDVDEDVRMQAASSAGHAHVREAVPNLLEWLKRQDAEPRRLAVSALGELADQLGDGSSRDTLQRALSERVANDRAAEVRAAAAVALARFAERDAAVNLELAKALEDPEPIVRLSAVEALDHVSLAHALALDANARATLSSRLIARTHDPEPAIRRASLHALGHLPSAPVTNALIRALSDRDESVRLAASLALGELGAAAGVPALARQLNADVRSARSALAALGRSDDAAAAQAIGAQLPRAALTRAATDALLTRARRSSREDVWLAARDAVLHQLQSANTREQLAALAEAVSELAAFCDVHAAEPALLAALRGDAADALTLTRALLALHSSELVPTLLAQLGASDPAHRSSWLSALELALREGARGPALEPARLEPLLASLGSQRARLLELLAITRSDGPWTATPTAEAPERAALARLLGVLPPSPERREQLEKLLDDGDADVREAAAIALAHAADAHTFSRLVQRLSKPRPVHENTLLLALGGGLSAHARGQQLETSLHDALFQQLVGPRLEAPEASVAASTLNALRSLADPRAPVIIARLLRTGSLTRRGAALLALGDFDVLDIRRLLRFTLQNERAPLALNAALALAEVGTEHDAEALLHAAERYSWPLPPAAAYAIARIAQRGVIKKHTLANVLCRLARQTNPHVRANAAAGLAALAAPACDGALTPEAWLDPALPSVVRVAAVRWLQALPELDAASATRRAQLLADCAHDPEPSVAQACRSGIPQPIAGGRLWVRSYANDGSTLQSGRIVALRRADASVFVGPSDANGIVVLPLDDGATNDVLLEDPADVPSPLAPPPLPKTPSASGRD